MSYVSCYHQQTTDNQQLSNEKKRNYKKPTIYQTFLVC